MLQFQCDIKTNIRCAKPLIVFLHAFPVNSKMWQPQTEFLQSKGYNTVTFDYPGFGGSKLIKSEISMKDYADLTHQILLSLGIDKAIFVGLSMGGYVALTLFRHYPKCFAGLLLSNTRATADDDAGRQKRYKMVEELKREMDLDPVISSHLEKFFKPDFRKKFSKEVQEIKDLMMESTVAGVIQAQLAMANRPDSTDLLKTMKFPVSIITGMHDELIKVQDAEKMNELIPGSQLTILDSAHLSNIEQTEQFNEILMDLIRISS
jgi:pimeloyl-ACP methyl ester carboxylesterase